MYQIYTDFQISEKLQEGPEFSRVYIFNFSMRNNNAAGMAWSFLTLKLQGVCMDMHLYMCTCIHVHVTVYMYIVLG